MGQCRSALGLPSRAQRWEWGGATGRPGRCTGWYPPSEGGKGWRSAGDTGTRGEPTDPWGCPQASMARPQTQGLGEGVWSKDSPGATATF